MNQKNIVAKQEVVKEVVASAKDNAAVVVFEYRGLSVAQMTQLRRDLREVGASLVIYKNSMVERAATELGKDELIPYLVGPNAFMFSKDVIAGPKVLAKFARFNDEVVIKAGLLEGRVVDGDGVKTVARLPGRDGLISMFLSVLNAPIQKFAATVQAIADQQN